MTTYRNKCYPLIIAKAVVGGFFMSDMVENRIYTYIAIFTFDKDGIVIEFPDFPGCCPCADKDDIEGALKNANEALRLHIKGMKNDGESIPIPTKEMDALLEPNQTLINISV